MTRFVTLILLLTSLVCVVSGCALPFLNPPVPTPVQPLDSGWEDRAIFRAGLIPAERGVLEQMPGASVYHVDLTIPADLQVLQGRQQVRYTNQEDQPLLEIYFRLFPNRAGGTCTVSALRVDGQPVEPAYELESSAMRVPLPAPLPPGQRVVIEMDFSVTVPRKMGGNYGLFGYFDDVLVLDEFYPVIPVYDDEGWNVEIGPPHGDVTYLDASFYLVRVTAPATLKVIATGIEVGREQQGETQVIAYAAGPARDFYIAASEKYTVVSEKVGDTTVNSYALQGREEGGKLALRYAVGALKSFNARFGPYPYTELDVASTPMTALGIEYPGIVGITLNVYDTHGTMKGVPNREVMESTVTHEVAHQWFYNVVGNDQLDEPWLDEAMAQYVTGLYYLDTQGKLALDGWRGFWYDRWERVGSKEIPIGLPARNYSDLEYGAIVYGRGPIFLEALANRMGPQFDEFLRDYYQSNKWGISTTAGFKQLAEQHCQCDLTPLFNEWVYAR